MNRTFLFILLLSAVIAANVSCKKTGTITDKNASVLTSADTLHFDTVFTTAGSVTQYVKIFNNNDQNLVLSNVQLMGGSSSVFSMNVDGLAGTSFSNIEIAPNDSVYVFVKVSIGADAQLLPFIVQDSIRYTFNGNTRFVQLDAYGRNAIYLRNKIIANDTTFTDTLPIVVQGGLYVLPNVTLSINSGTSLYFHADAAVQIFGTLIANGDSNNRVNFQCDRLDIPYSKYPGSWPGIYFNDSSKNNVLTYANIKNAYQGVIVSKSTLPNKLTLNQCIIDNISAEGILASNSTISATNCLISNCGTNISIQQGGYYDFNQCTIASYDNDYVAHKIPVVSISDNDGTNPFALNCTFNNSIIYGYGGLVDNEIGLNLNGGLNSKLYFNNVLYRQKKFSNANIYFTGSAEFGGSTPAFVSIDLSNHVYDFHLQDTSICKGYGNATYPVNIDLDGKTRTLPNDIGCYKY